jgi:uncharacterized protein (DUF697 family)
VRLTASFVDGCFCNVGPTPGAALVRNVNHDRGAEEDIALVGKRSVEFAQSITGFAIVAQIHTKICWTLGNVALHLASACELSHIKSKVAGRIRSRATAVFQAQARQMERPENERAKGKIVARYDKRCRIQG